MSRSLAPLVVFLAAICAAPAPASADAVADLHALFDREWERDLSDNPVSATYLGDPRYNDRLPDISPAAQAARQAADARVLDDLARIPRDALPPAEQLNYDLFRREYETRQAAVPFHGEYYSIEAGSGPQSLNELAELVPFETVADYETWLRRMRAIPAYLDQYGERLRRGAREKRTQPRAVMERVLEPLAKQVTDTPADSPFFERFRTYPESIAAADRARLSEEARQVIADAVILTRFFEGELEILPLAKLPAVEHVVVRCPTVRHRILVHNGQLFTDGDTCRSGELEIRDRDRCPILYWGRRIRSCRGRIRRN